MRLCISAADYPAIVTARPTMQNRQLAARAKKSLKGKSWNMRRMPIV